MSVVGQLYEVVPVMMGTVSIFLISLLYTYKSSTFLVVLINTKFFPKQNISSFVLDSTMHILLGLDSLKYDVFVTQSSHLFSTMIIRGLVLCIWEDLAFIKPIIVLTVVHIVTWLIWEVISAVLMFVKVPPVSLDKVDIWILSSWISAYNYYTWRCWFPSHGLLGSIRLFCALSNISVLQWIGWLNWSGS